MSEAVKESIETIEEVETIERPYTLRKLSDADLFPLLQLLRKLGVKEFKDAFIEARKKIVFNPNAYETEEEKKAALENLQETTGIDVMLNMADLLISKIDTHKDDIYGFFSGLAGVSADEIQHMEFGTLPLMIYDAFYEVRNTAFFKVLSKLL